MNSRSHWPRATRTVSLSLVQVLFSHKTQQHDFPLECQKSFFISVGDRISDFFLFFILIHLSHAPVERLHSITEFNIFRRHLIWQMVKKKRKERMSEKLLKKKKYDQSENSLVSMMYVYTFSTWQMANSWYIFHSSG